MIVRSYLFMTAPQGFRNGRKKRCDDKQLVVDIQPPVCMTVNRVLRGCRLLIIHPTFLSLMSTAMRTVDCMLLRCAVCDVDDDGDLVASCTTITIHPPRAWIHTGA